MLRDLLLKRVRPLVDWAAKALAEYAGDQPAPATMPPPWGPRPRPRLVPVPVPSIFPELDAGIEGLRKAVDSMLGPPNHRPAPLVDRDTKPATVLPPRPANQTSSKGHGGRPETERATPTANGSRPSTCSKCGFVGGRATGCGTAHRTQFGTAVMRAVEPALRESTEAHRERLAQHASVGLAGFKAAPLTASAPAVRNLKPTPAAVDAARTRITERLARMRKLDEARKAVAPRERDDNPNAEERWTEEEILEARDVAEARKFGGELPIPTSSWSVP